MKLTADYHTHTTFSHGKGTVEDNVIVAIQRGIKTIGISDHSYGHAFYGIKKKSIPVMRAEIDRLNKKYPEIEILLGIEANILNSDGDIDVDEDNRIYLDYVLAGYHFGSTPKKSSDIMFHLNNYLSKNSQNAYDRALTNNTKAYLNVIKRHNPFAITHPGAKGPIDIVAVAKCANQFGTHLEINTRHGHLSNEQIAIACQHHATFIVSSDAHVANRVASVDAALERVRQCKAEEYVINIF